MLPLVRIVSGGQTGADRAGLDVARKYEFPYGGWCPKGRKAEDGPIGSDYLLAETPSGNYLQRTEWNARDCDGTVIFTMKSKLTGGSKRTEDFANKHVKPCLHLYSEKSDDPAGELRGFVEKHSIRHLNVAGSRGSKEPELHAWVCEVMEAAFFGKEPECFAGQALSYLGPEIELTGYIDNADATMGYAEKPNADAWRIYYDLKGHTPTQVGGDCHYILIEKGSGQILQTGIEHGE